MSEKVIHELVKTFDELIDYTMYMKMVTKFDGGTKDNLLLEACRILVKVKESKLFKEEKVNR